MLALLLATVWTIWKYCGVRIGWQNMQWCWVVGGHDVTFGNNLESLWKDFGKNLEIFRKDFGKIALQASQTQHHHRHHDCHCHWRHWYHIKSTICSEWDHYTNTRMNCAVQATFIFSLDFLKNYSQNAQHIIIHPFSHSNKFGW